MRPFVRNIKMIESDGTTETLKIRDNSLRDSLLFVRDFGADPSLDDNAPYINAAIRAAADQHKALVFDSDLYYIKSPLVVELKENEGHDNRDRFNKLVIYGNCARIAADHCHGMVIFGERNSVNEQWLDFELYDMTFICKGGTQYNGMDGIVFGNNANGQMNTEGGFTMFKNVAVRYFDRAFHFLSCRHMEFIGCTADFIKEECLCFDMSDVNPRVDDLKFIGCEFNGAAGIKVHTGGAVTNGRISGIHFDDCDFYKNVGSPVTMNTYIDFTMSNHIKASDIWFNNCAFDQINGNDLFVFTNTYLAGLGPDEDHTNRVDITDCYVGDIHICDCYIMNGKRILNCTWADRIWFKGNIVYAHGLTQGIYNFGAIHSSYTSYIFIRENMIDKYLTDAGAIPDCNVVGGLGRSIGGNLGATIREDSWP